MTLRRTLYALLALALAGELLVRVFEYSLIGGESGALTSYVVQQPGYWTIRPGLRLWHPERYGDKRYSFDARGFRNPDRPRSQPARRVVFLGDSVTFGLGVDDERVYPRRIEERWQRERPGEPPLEALNLAMFAYSPVHERAVLEAHGLAFRPELIVLQLYMNDFTESQWSPESELQVGVWLRLQALKNRVVNESALYRRVRQGLLRVGYLAVHDLRRKYFPETLNAAEPLALRERFAAHPDEEFQAFADISAMRDLAHEAGSGFLVILTPNEVQLFDDAYDAIDERIAAWCARERITFLDLLPLLRARADRAELFLDGLHLSERGHDAVANALWAPLGAAPEAGVQPSAAGDRAAPPES
jgi:lysophospholipase L1-like esterase